MRRPLDQRSEDMNVEDIINAIRNSRVRITDHADEEAVDNSLSYEERESMGGIDHSLSSRSRTVD